MKKVDIVNTYETAMVDDSDFEEVCKHSWHLTKNGRAATRINGKYVYMSQLIAKLHGIVLEGNEELHHKNEDRLDNTSENIRPMDKSLHSFERCIYQGPRRNNKSGFKGVRNVERYNKKNPWLAQIGSPNTNLGYFKTAKDAARAYDKAARERFGPNTYTNFPL